MLFGLALLASVSSYASTATDELILQVDKNLYGEINANFDGSVTIQTPKLKVNGKKMKLYADGFYDSNTSNAEVNATAICKLMNRDVLVDYNSVVGWKTDLLVLDPAANVDEIRENKGAYLEKVTCR